MSNPHHPDVDKLTLRYEHERQRRLTSDRGTRLELSGDLVRYLDDPHTAIEARPGRELETEVLIVGAGFGGLVTAVRLGEARVHDFLVIDEAGDVGGVWYWNRYPGASCDVDAYTYLPLLEETGYMPTVRYAGQPEIHAHAQRIARHGGVYGRALFHTSASSLRWDAERTVWQVQTDRGDSITARFVVLATGGAYSRPKLPAIPGVADFRGDAFHASRWDNGVTGNGENGSLSDLATKTVAIIGTGATALQAVPKVAEHARQLYVVQRTPNTVGPRRNTPTDPEWVSSLTPGWQQRRIENFAALTSGEGADEDLIGDGWTAIYHDLIRPGQIAGATAEEREEAARLADFRMMEAQRRRVEDLVDDPDIAERLKPYYRYLCKRPGFHDSYLQAFNRPNVKLLDTEGRGVERITPRGLVVDGTEYEVDVLVYATGFLTGDDPFTTRLGAEVIGVDGLSLANKWSEGPVTLHGIFTSGFPNLFLYPDSQQQSGYSFNFLHTVTEAALHAAHVISTVRASGAGGFDVDVEAEAAWVARVVEHAHDREAFLASCTPGRFSNEGNVSTRSAKAAAYPLSATRFFQMWHEWRDGTLDGLRLLEVNVPSGSGAKV